MPRAERNLPSIDLLIFQSMITISRHISSNFVSMAATKKSAEKADDLSTTVLNDNGLKGLKVVRYTKWIETISPVELVDMLEKGRKFMGCPLKGPLVITCKDGASK